MNEEGKEVNGMGKEEEEDGNREDIGREGEIEYKIRI
jgi:hypothetical protein